MSKEAEMMEYVFSIDFKTLILSLITIAVASIAIYALVKKVQEITGLETKGMRERRQLNESLASMKKDIDEMKSNREQDREQIDKYNQKITDVQDTLMDAINKLSMAVARKDLEDMRWTIIDFGNSIRDGRVYDQEAYTHIVDIYDEYEKLLKENGMENGRVTTAMKIINERFENGMRNGFPC